MTEEAEKPSRRLWTSGRIAWAAVVLALAGAVLTSPAWGPRALSSLAFFRVRRVELEGVRYASAAELVGRLRVDTLTSIWTELAPLEKRVAGHPMVARATVARRLPGTLRVQVDERVPVAMAPARAGIAVYDSAGTALPVEPSSAGGLDVPLVAVRDTTLLRLLGRMRDEAPRLFARVSEARRAAGPGGARDEFEFTVTSPAPAGAWGGTTVVVRAMADVSVERLADLVPVEDDLQRRRVRVAEIDLRYRDQVIARLQ